MREQAFSPGCSEPQAACHRWRCSLLRKRFFYAIDRRTERHARVYPWFSVFVLSVFVVVPFRTAVASEPTQPVSTVITAIQLGLAPEVVAACGIDEAEALQGLRSLHAAVDDRSRLAELTNDLQVCNAVIAELEQVERLGSLSADQATALEQTYLQCEAAEQELASLSSDLVSAYAASASAQDQAALANAIRDRVATLPTEYRVLDLTESEASELFEALLAERASAHTEDPLDSASAQVLASSRSRAAYLVATASLAANQNTVSALYRTVLLDESSLISE